MPYDWRTRNAEEDGVSPVALNIHQKLRERLTTIATEAVSKMRVEKGIYLHRDAAQLLAAGDTALPDGTLKRTLAAAISDRPFSGFIVGRIADELSERFKYKESEPKPLTELPGFEKPEIVAANLVEAFTSLPWSYRFIYPLPFNVGSTAPDTEYRLSEAIAVVRGGSSFAGQYPTTAAGTLGDLMSGRFVFGQAPPWEFTQFYLVVKADGFNTGAFTSQLANNIRLLIRTFVGLIDATALVDYEYVATWGSYQPLNRDRWIYGYVRDHDTWRTTPSVRFDAEHAERIESLKLGEPDTMVAACGLVHTAFEDTDNAALLRRCAQWHFDSQCGTNHLLQFVQATVAIEILLGDKATSDRVGLGELLANRCAYSLARHPQERHDLLKEFRQIYDTRSAIVHRGKADLSDEETTQLWRLKYLGARLIFNELKLMGRKP